jgi:penicillin-binding protein 1A
VAVPPVLVTRVLSHDGAVLYQADASAQQPQRVLDAPLVDTEVAVLRQVVDRGTGVNARIGRPVAGKTGTGEQWRDAWFVGFTPELVTSVWVGFPERQRSMQPPATRITVTGGSWPAQIWQLYMAKALAQVPVSDFPPPPPGVLTADAGAGPANGAGVQVAKVVGMPVTAAEDQLTRDGFRAVRRPVPSNDYPPGYVVAQDPAGGSTAPGGSVVTLDVSTGPSPATTSAATVPDLLGLSADDARAKVSDAGLKANVVREREPPSADASSRAGRVWKQSPQENTKAPPGSTVTVWVNPGDSGG